MSKKLTECIHGMYFKSCAICIELTEKQVKQEYNEVMTSRKHKASFDCLEASDAEITEKDNDYDIDTD
jgi:hypothetical protein